MDSIYQLLDRYRLEPYYNKFRELGVKDERDFLDGVTDEDLLSFGLTQVEKNRFNTMKEAIRRFRAPETSSMAQSVQKSVKSFSLLYTYPKCREPKNIQDMDPAQNTVEDLMLRICHLEAIESSRGVCLFTMDGMPLSDDPFFNTWSLADRHIESGDLIYAIFTSNENLKTATPSTEETQTKCDGTDKIRCHIMLKGDFEVTVSLASGTMSDLKKKLEDVSGIPAQVLHDTNHSGSGNTLESCGITEGSTVYFSLSTFSEEDEASFLFFIDDIVPSVQQTPKGISTLLSSLYTIKSKGSMASMKKLIGYIRKLTGCHPLVQSLYQLLCQNQSISRNQKTAVVEGLYILFRAILPDLGTTQGEKVIEDLDVFEYSTHCWAYLLSESEKETCDYENYTPIPLVNEEGSRFCEPVKIPGLPGASERAAVLQKIKNGETIPNCTEVLRETSLKRDSDTEKILLSVCPFVRTYYLWITHDNVACQNFNIKTGKTLEEMTEEIKKFSHLAVAPPLQLKSLGFEGPALVYLNKENLGVYLNKNKLTPQMIEVFDCLDGKIKTLDVEELAAQTGDLRSDNLIVTTRTPKEAILVLVDASSSMAEKCYGSTDIQKINAVKELFDNFASRTMAHDFHHILGLVKFASEVRMVGTITETLENFKKHVRDLEPGGKTRLYDALRRGTDELQNIKKKFPNCRLRILCLTDGNDVGSSNKPADVAIKLIQSNIIVDSVLLGKVENNVLHGISIATGGCCFKPETSIDGLKLFEIETVLSLEMRMPKDKANPSTITEEVLQGFFATHGYDTFPPVVLPSQITSKVIPVHNALKKRMQEDKDSRFMEKDRRILEELKNLHCDPHPYFTILPSESDFTFWQILMEAPPDTPYEKGVFELFCQFGLEYPVKPPTVRFVTRIYHCNINNVGRICHNIFDRNYNAHVTMRDILDAVFGLLISPEPQDPLDSILAEEYLTNREAYMEQARQQTEEAAGESLNDKEKKLVGTVEESVPQHLLCPLTKKLFVDPVKSPYGSVYERKAIEKHLQFSVYDPQAVPKKRLRRTDVKPCENMKKMVKEYRISQIQETSV